MLPQNRYLGDLVAGKLTKSTGKGTPQMEIEFELKSSAGAGRWDPVAPGTKRTVYVYLTDAAWETSMAKLESLKFNGNFEQPGFGVTQDVQLDCEIDSSYDGKPREKWELASWGRKENDPADASTVMKLTARWNARNGAAPKPAIRPLPPPAATRPKPAPAPAATAMADGPTADACDSKEDAWLFYNLICEKASVAVNIDIWAKTIASIGLGDEATFGPAEWRELAKALESIPF